MEICKFFNNSKMTFFWSKKPPFEKATSSNDKIKVFFTEQIGSKDIWNSWSDSWMNPFGKMQSFQLQLNDIFYLKRFHLKTKTKQNTKQTRKNFEFFLPKLCVNLLWKYQFFGLYKTGIFIVLKSLFSI